MPFAAACISFISDASANAEIRDWKLTDGSEFRGEIDEVDEVAQAVKLKNDKGGAAVIPLDELSTLDRAWVLQWIEFAEELAEAAEEVKMTLVACDIFRNGMEESDSIRRFRELLPIIRATVPHDPERDFMGGTSGGALRTFNLSTDLPEETWTGIYSNGGWLGGEKNWNRDYPTMRVVMVNGDEDKAANSWVDSDSEILQTHGCRIAVVAFEGGHQIPPPSVQVKAFKWLLGEID